MAALRSAKGHASGYSIPLSDIQSAAFQQLYKSLLTHTEPEEDLVQLYHEFVWSLLIPQPEATVAAEWICPFLCYLAACALRDDGSFISPDTLSGILCKFKYLCYTAAIVQADLTKIHYERGMIG